MKTGDLRIKKCSKCNSEGRIWNEKVGNFTLCNCEFSKYYALLCSKPFDGSKLSFEDYSPAGLIKIIKWYKQTLLFMQEITNMNLGVVDDDRRT